MSNSVTYTFKLYAPINVVNLPTPVNNLKSVKVKKLLYRFKTLNQYVLSVRVNGWDSATNFDGLNSTNNYTCNVFNDGNLSVLNYINNDGLPDVINTYGSSSHSSLTIEILTDGAYLADLSLSNPILVEMEFYQQ